MNITLNIKLTGLSEAVGGMQQKAASIQSGVQLGLERVAVTLRDSITQYSQAGHPGHPNVQTGRLSNSIKYIVSGNKATVGSDAGYAPYVEYGHMQTMAWGKPMKSPRMIPPYPFFRPGIVDVFDSGQAENIFKTAVSQALGK